MTYSPSSPTGSPTELPLPTTEAQEHSLRLVRQIRDEMERQDGRLGFDRFMELALYAPGLGYYTAGARKFGEAGDFVTAPEISPLFARCLARQCRELLDRLGGGEILEFGAGSGALAADLLLELEILEFLPKRYLILEISPDLKERQRETLEAQAPHLLERVIWLDHMPEQGFRGVVVANEVLDAMPVHRFRVEADGVREGFVRWSGERFEAFWDQPATPGLADAVTALQKQVGKLGEGYESELNLRAGPWLEALGERMAAGALLLIDYGYPASEYYHPQRSSGSLMCYYRHRAHGDVLALPGLQDITAHVDFSAVAAAGLDAGFELAGYTNQANFLLGCGLDQLVTDSDPYDIKVHMALMQGVKRLTLPSEMGERFKVLCLSRGIEGPLMGFGMRELSGRL
jgi:SAM-dependent MidA family methyltransferase